jgi:hypothetical protein
MCGVRYDVYVATVVSFYIVVITFNMSGCFFVIRVLG